MAEPFYTKGLNFSCKRCSHCCRHEPGYVYLSEVDLTNLSQYFNIEKKDFILKYCRFVSYYDGKKVLCLQEKSNYDCILWDRQCLAYEAKPIQCTTYPFWSYILKSASSWEQEGKECPGINNGTLRSKEEIQESLDLQINNIPITMGDEV